jgi:hypothetical protein
MENPFQFGRELGAEELVDREDEIAGAPVHFRSLSRSSPTKAFDTNTA